MFLTDWLRGWFIGDNVKKSNRPKRGRGKKLPGIDYSMSKKKDPGPQFHDLYEQQFIDDPSFSEWSENVIEICDREKKKRGMRYD